MRSGREQIRERILLTATRLFAENGFHETPTRLLAEQAGISEPTLFSHFPTKAHILQALFKEGWQYFLEVAKTTIAATENPFERFRMALRGCVQYLLDNPYILQVMLVEERQNNPELRELIITDEMLEFIEIMTDTLRQGQAKGIFSRDCNARLMIYTAIGIVETLLELQGPSGKRLSIPCSHQDIEDVCYRFMASFILPAWVVNEVVYHDGKLCLLQTEQDIESYITAIKNSPLPVNTLRRIRKLSEAQWREIEDRLEQ